MPHSPRDSQVLFNSLRKIRVAVVQLESHPAFTIGRTDFLSEPFFSHVRCLSLLVEHGFDAAKDLRRICRDRYLLWAETRMRGIIRWFKERFPQNADNAWADMPDIVVFPEGGVPRQHLHLLVEFARDTGTVVFAGTHCFDAEEEAVQDYNRLGIVHQEENGNPIAVGRSEVKNLDGLVKNADPKTFTHPYTRLETNRILRMGDKLASISVLPIICPNEQPTFQRLIRRRCYPIEFGEERSFGKEAARYLGKLDRAKEIFTDTIDGEYAERSCTVRLRAKTTLAVSERTEGGGGGGLEMVPPQVVTVRLPERAIRGNTGGDLRVLPMICAEALNRLADPDFGGGYDLVVIPSFNKDFSYFSPVAEYLAHKRIPVAYCNDGLFGDSCIQFMPDTRHSAGFFSGPQNGRLPKEADGILVADVTPGFGGAEHGGTDPRQYYQLVALAAVVHDDPHHPPSYVAHVLDKARELMTKIPLPPGTDGPFKERKSVLDRLKQAERESAPGAVQRMNLRHLIQLLENPSNAFPYEWKIRAWDCRIENKDVPEEFKDSGQIPPHLLRPLRDLDSDLAALCHIKTARWFERELTARNSPTDEERAGVLTRVRNECRNRMGPGVSNVLAHLERIKDDARAKAKERLHHLVGNLVERFGATSAWLLPVRDGRVGGELTITHNTTARFRQQPLGIINRVKETRRPYLVNAVLDDSDRIVDPYYQEFMFTTRSELAVPVFESALTSPRIDGDDALRPNKPRLLAVLNLESNQAGAFIPAAVADLQAAVSELVPELLIYFAATDMDCLTAWHPALHGWGSANLLDQFCYAVGSAFGRSGEPLLTCTLWNHDRKKEKIQARSTVGFDYEYLTGSSLDMDSLTGRVIEITKDTTGTNRLRPRVYRVNLSSTVTKPEPPKPVDVEKVWERVARKRKIRRMGIAEMIVAPLIGPNQQGEPRVDGTLNLYVYNHSPEAGGPRPEGLSRDDLVFQLSGLANRTVADFYRLQRAVTAATLTARLVESSHLGVPPFELIRVVIAEAFEAEGCSILCQDPDSTTKPKVRLVATSGLAIRGASAHPETPTYSYVNLQSHEAALRRSVAERKSHRGITLTLLSRAGRTIRMLDVADRDEKVQFLLNPPNAYPDTGKRSPRSDRPSVKPVLMSLLPGYLHSEALSPLSSFHHRLLGVSFGNAIQPKGGTYKAAMGSIRLFRTMAARPFVRHDELVLEDHGRLVAPLFRWYVEDSSRWKRLQPGVQDLMSLKPIVTRPSSNVIDPDAGAKGFARVEAVRRLLYSSVGPIEWNRNFVRCMFQDLLTVFEDDGAVLVDLRFVVLTEAGAVLRPYEVLSRYSQQQPDEVRGRDVACGHLNNGWRAIVEQRPLKFLRADGGFTEIHRDSKFVHSGVCWPFRLFAHDHLIEGVLSLDFERTNESYGPVRWGKEHIRFLALATRQLGWLGLANHPDESSVLTDHDYHELEASPVEAWYWLGNRIKILFSENHSRKSQDNGKAVKVTLSAIRLFDSDHPEQILVSQSLEGQESPTKLPAWVGKPLDGKMLQKRYSACRPDAPDVEFELYGVKFRNPKWLQGDELETKTEFVFPLYIGSACVGHIQGSVSLTAEPLTPDRPNRKYHPHLRELRSQFSRLTECWCQFAYGNLPLHSKPTRLWEVVQVPGAGRDVFRFHYRWGTWVGRVAKSPRRKK